MVLTHSNFGLLGASLRVSARSGSGMSDNSMDTVSVVHPWMDPFPLSAFPGFRIVVFVLRTSELLPGSFCLSLRS